MGSGTALSLIKRTTWRRRHLYVFRLVTWVGVGACLASSLTNDQAEALVRRVQERYNGAKTLAVEFVESYEILGRSRPTEAGKLTLRKQGKMRWDYTRPAGKLFISDGKTVYLYTAQDNRVEKIPMRNTEDMRAPLAFLLGHLDLKKEFNDLRVREDGLGTWLEGNGKTDRVPYESVDMLVSEDGSIRQLKVKGRDGSMTSFVLSGERLNPQVEDKLFHFAIPAGADVVDAASFSGEGK